MKLVRITLLKVTGGGAGVWGFADMWVWIREMTLKSNKGYRFVFAAEMVLFFMWIVEIIEKTCMDNRTV